MKTNNRTFNQEGTYVAPALTALDIESEGLLCVSGDLTPEKWETGNSNWFEE